MSKVAEDSLILWSVQDNSLIFLSGKDTLLVGRSTERFHHDEYLKSEQLEFLLHKGNWSFRTITSHNPTFLNSDKIEDGHILQIDFYDVVSAGEQSFVRIKPTTYNDLERTDFLEKLKMSSEEVEDFLDTIKKKSLMFYKKELPELQRTIKIERRKKREKSLLSQLQAQVSKFDERINTLSEAVAYHQKELRENENKLIKGQQDKEKAIQNGRKQIQEILKKEFPDL